VILVPSSVVLRALLAGLASVVLALIGILTLALIGPAQSATAVAGSQSVCRFQDARLREISGMAWSILHTDILWLHNDSGGGPYLFAVNSKTCATVARVRLANAPARDYEAIATGRDAAGKATIWVGDIGDNNNSWLSVRILAVPEPARLVDDETLVSTTYRFTYNDGSHNAETLLADPRTPKFWVVTKQLLNGQLWAVPPLQADHIGTAKPVADAGGIATDGSISPDGSRTVVRDYFGASVYAGLPSATSFETELARLTLPLEPQGEAIAWGQDGRSLLVASEADDRLLSVALPKAAWTASALAAAVAGATPSTVPTTSSPTASTTPAAAPAAGLGHRSVGPAIVLVLAVGAYLLARALRRRPRPTAVEDPLKPEDQPDLP
jgi:hypothetical protein